MRVALSVNNKLPFINDTLPQPLENYPSFLTWFRVNSVVILWLYNLVSKEIITSILFAIIAREIWEELRTCFSCKSGSRIF